MGFMKWMFGKNDEPEEDEPEAKSEYVAAQSPERRKTLREMLEDNARTAGWRSPEEIRAEKEQRKQEREATRYQRKIDKDQKEIEKAQRAEAREANRVMREAKESGKSRTKDVAQKLKPVKVHKVKDEKTLQTVERATTRTKDTIHTVQKTRSQELQEIKDKAHDKQQAIEDAKRIKRENEAAARSGARGAMGFVDRNVDRVAEVAEKKRAIEDKVTDIREKISPGSTKTKPKTKTHTKSQPKISAAQQRRIAQQMAKSQKALAPRKRTPFAATRNGAPFGIQRNVLSVQKSSGSLNAPRTSALNKPHTSALNAPQKISFGSQHRGNPFAVSKSSNPFGVSKTSKPFNPIGYSSKSHRRITL